MSWAPGTIVVCVDAALHGHGPEAEVGNLAEGDFYTVRKYACGLQWENGVHDAVWLNEIVRPSNAPHLVRDRPWGASRFRLAEGAASESERARAIRSMEVK